MLWLRYDALPHADRYRERIVSSIERASGMAVKVRALHGGWEGLRPRVTLEGFELADRAGRPAFALERAEVTLSWWALFAGRVRFHDVDFYRPALALRRGRDGLVYLGDKALNASETNDDRAFAQWLLAQPRLGVHDATLDWRDDLTGAPEVRFTSVQIAMRKHLGHHHAAVTALPPPELAGRIDIRADMSIARAAARWVATGQLFAEAVDTDLGGLRAHLPVAESLRSGVGSVRVWATFAQGAVHDVTADINLRDAKAQLAADALPLALASISGRATYRARADGFAFATEGLRFRLPDGSEARPGKFSLSRTNAAGKPPLVEVRADGIDLKIAATLMDYFPMPRDIKGQVQRFAPRGRLVDAALTWTGADAAHMKSYSLKGRFEELAVNAVDAWPGVSGMSGSLEGTEAGGSLHIDARRATVDLPHVFQAPLALDTLAGDATWKHEGAALRVDLADVRFANADAEGKVAGMWRSLPDVHEANLGAVDLHGSVVRAVASQVPRYLPNVIAPVRDWLAHALQAGHASDVTFELKGDLRQFPFGAGREGHFLVDGAVDHGRLRYHPDWPAVDAIDGRFRFENRRMEIRARQAAIFSSRASNVSAVIDDLGGQPAVLVLDGNVDTSGADSMRFLRESPLVNGPGSFTRAVAIEGPGRLRLHLDFPLGDGQPVRVAGEYQFAGATATVGQDLAMRDVRGRLAFTDRGVRAPEITGTLFGKPARVAMSMQGESQVLTTVEGAIDARALDDYLPAAFARAMKGGTTWRARVLSGPQGTDVAVSSDLAGLEVGLPQPLAKGAPDKRALSVSIAHLGADNEVSTAALGGVIFGRFQRMPGTGAWNVALRFGAPLRDEPVHEGVWLYGALPVLDVDAWQAVFRESGEAAGRESPGMGLRGVDLAAGRMRYLGRDFSDMRARLERVGAQWNGRLDSPNVAGDVQWNPEGKGRLVARLARLAIAESATNDTHANATSGEGGDLPALDVTAERFEFRGHWLGHLDLKAQPAGDEWRIDALEIGNDHARFHSSGGWRRRAADSTTTLAVRLDADNLNKLLAQFGYGDYLKRGTGSLEGTLVWAGYPYDFALANLAGRFRVDAKSGQFAKIEPGAGKLLGLLSLQSLPRRATLDFRDVFSEGFAFDRIQGDVRVAHGVLITDNFEISGSSAFVGLNGDVSLPDETQNLTLRVVPEVTEGVALAATLIGTPVLGLSTLLVSKLLKNPLGKVVAYEYHVTGTWDNPHVTRTSAAPPKATAATSP